MKNVIVLALMCYSLGSFAKGPGAIEQCDHHIDEYFYKSCLWETREKLAKELGENTCDGILDEAFYYMCRDDHGLEGSKEVKFKSIVSWCDISVTTLPEACVSKYSVLDL